MDLLKGNVRQIYFRYLGAAFGSALISSIYGLVDLSLIHISEPTRLGMISYAVFCLKKKKKKVHKKNESMKKQHITARKDPI